MIAIVVLTHERVHLLRQCVENVLGRTSALTTEIVIWNNASTDGTRESLDGLDEPRLRVVPHPENIVQNAYRRAFALTRAPYLVELDDDMVDAPAEWDRTLFHAYSSLPDIGFLAADLADDEHDFVANIRYRVRPHLYSLHEVNGVRILDGPTGGGCAMTSRELHDAVGGFRENRRHVFWEEETAYLEDISRLGYRGATLAELKLRHAGGEYYSRQSVAKHEYWRHYWKQEQLKNRVKRGLLTIPFARALNERHGWFTVTETPEL